MFIRALVCCLCPTHRDNCSFLERMERGTTVASGMSAADDSDDAHDEEDLLRSSIDIQRSSLLGDPGGFGTGADLPALVPSSSFFCSISNADGQSHPSLAAHAPWKTGILPYEMVFARKAGGARGTKCSAKNMVRIDNYFPRRPLSARSVRDQIGTTFLMYRATLLPVLKNAALNNADKRQVLRWISQVKPLVFRALRKDWME